MLDARYQGLTEVVCDTRRDIVGIFESLLRENEYPKILQMRLLDLFPGLPARFSIGMLAEREKSVLFNYSLALIVAPVNDCVLSVVRCGRSDGKELSETRLTVGCDALFVSEDGPGSIKVEVVEPGVIVTCSVGLDAKSPFGLGSASMPTFPLDEVRSEMRRDASFWAKSQRGA
ncbi:hypothetical protein [Luteimonas sp. FCS-9]|uniref:hypothetical protein n=1 Tax=Luteimonas sp. FCS-9 TaxID=1547516 RepID=UPI0012E06090|nr:hypothetical protein [Luteimonas sp. FCS-9]